MSWTGSEHARKEQGTCRPPAHAPNKTPRFVIPAGVRALIRRVDEDQYRNYKTTKERGFDRYEFYDRKQKLYTFRDQGYQLAVKAVYVKHNK